MANVLDRQILEDGPRNAVVKLTGVLDTENVSEIPAISLQDFTNNSPNTHFVGFRIDHIWHSIGNALEIQLDWNAATPKQIVAVAGRGRESFSSVGGLQPDQTLPGYDGSINLLTTGFDPNTTQNFSILLEMVKLYRY